MSEGILSLIGNTPLVELKRLFRHHGIRLFAKLEQFNPGGSIKDRPAVSIIQHGIKTGAIGKDTVVIESSSGNMGIGLAQVCSYYQLRFICVVDPKTTSQNIELLKAYNADVVMVSKPDSVTGEYLPARIRQVEELLKAFPESFWPNQYANRLNANAHYQTMDEITLALKKKVDYLFCATSTCGTLRGCAEYRRNHGLSTRIVAVDAVGSVIFGGRRAKRLIPGHGAAVVPSLYDPGLADHIVQVTDLECVIGCRRLAAEEAFLAGGSSGAVVSAIQKSLPEMAAGSTCVAIFADRGERYLDTIYSEKWVREHFGDVSGMWEPQAELHRLVTSA
jgi:cysteine synthase A